MNTQRKEMLSICRCVIFDGTSSLWSILLFVPFCVLQCESCLRGSEGKHSQSPSNLVQLLCAMQKSLLIWCSNQIKSGGEEGKQTATSLIIKCKLRIQVVGLLDVLVLCRGGIHQMLAVPTTITQIVGTIQ